MGLGDDRHRHRFTKFMPCFDRVSTKGGGAVERPTKVASVEEHGVALCSMPVSNSSKCSKSPLHGVAVVSRFVMEAAQVEVDGRKVLRRRHPISQTRPCSLSGVHSSCLECRDYSVADSDGWKRSEMTLGMAVVGGVELLRGDEERDRTKHLAAPKPLFYSQSARRPEFSGNHALKLT